MSFNREETRILINLLQENECLWNVKCMDYRNAIKKIAAYKEMANQFENRTVEDIKSKIKNLRAQHSGERSKIRKGGKSGSGGDGVYVPRWKFYDALNFLFAAGPTGKKPKSAIIAEENEMLSACAKVIGSKNTRIENYVNYLGSELEAIEKEGPQYLNEAMKSINKVLADLDSKIQAGKNIIECQSFIIDGSL